MPETWNRGGRPVWTRSASTGRSTRSAANCSPAEVVLFGSGARDELGTTGDVDLLVVLADGDPADPRRVGFDIREGIGYEPRADG